MPIWIDGDACPRPVKDAVFRAGHKKQIPVKMVANQYIAIPASPFIQFIQVESGFDKADNFIVEQVSSIDLVITADIPLAAGAIEKGAAVINPRGEQYTKDTIGARLTMRNFNETLRNSGLLLQDGPAAYNQKDMHNFAAALDKWIQKNINTNSK
jgi:uncharacterized protein YaiI (UPF0178 family)